MPKIMFVDLETTRLEPIRHHITWWEAAIIVPTDAGMDHYHWQIMPDLGFADPGALRIGQFEQRLSVSLHGTPRGSATVLQHPQMAARTSTNGLSVAEEIAELTAQAVLVGSKPTFDQGHLETFLGCYGIAPGWYHHPLDITAAAIGYAAAKGLPMPATGTGGAVTSSDASRAIGVDPQTFARHTAMGDARWVQAQYNAMGLSHGPTEEPHQ